MLVQSKTNRQTGTRVDVIDNREQRFMDDDQKWYTVCVDHGGLCGHSTRALAISWSAEPTGWCPGCQKD